jgi:adenosylmethionine-8-amino-7-oxononanoate aminotransferase
MVSKRLVERVRARGPRLRDEFEAALKGAEIVGEVRGRGFLLGVELVDPRDGNSFLPHELDAASLVDDVAFEHELLVTSTHSNRDGYAGDEVLLAPAYTTTDAELAQMVERFAATISSVERAVKAKLGAKKIAG